MVKVAVCDDSEVQRGEAVAALNRYSASRRLDLEIASFPSPAQLLADARLGAFDVVFMDIEFEGKPEGIQAVARINQVAPHCQVVYLSNYLQYSVDVYRTDHVWFVLKGQLEERLPEVFSKLARIGEAQRSQIVVATREAGILKLPCEEVVYLERRSRITRLVTSGAAYELREKIGDVAGKLPASLFAHCHSSFVVNMARVVELHDGQLRMDNGDAVPVSRRYAKSFRERFFDWADRWTV